MAAAMPTPTTRSNLAPKLAICSDQLAGMLGGAESILMAALDLYPEAPIYTTVHREGFLPALYEARHPIHTSVIQKLPFGAQKYKAYLPFMPAAVELFNLQEYDLLFSSHHSVIKGVIPRPDAWHVCYCHSPARYLWDLFWTYAAMNGFGAVQSALLALVANPMRTWDVAAANRVHVFLANSSFTARRIQLYYRRQAHVLFPPVDIHKFSNEGESDYYIMIGRLVAYKGFELAIDVFNELGKRLIIMGGGPDLERLRAKARPNVTLLGRVDESTLIKHMNQCKGFIFPGKEDFGIVMAEAQSAGKPVIALAAGGALDIVTHGETGILAKEYSQQAFKDAIAQAEATHWDAAHIQQQATRFNSQQFRAKLKTILDNPQAYAD